MGSTLRQFAPIAFGLIGGMFGGGVLAPRIGAAIGTIIGGMVAQSGVSAPKTQLNDLDIERYEYGTFINEYFGIMGQVSGTIIDCRYITNANGQRVPAGIEKVIVPGRRGGTGGAPKPPTPDSAAYYLSAAYMWGKGPLDVDLLEWEDSENKRVIYNRAGTTEEKRGFELIRQFEGMYANMPTSATSVTVGTGSKTFTTQSNKEIYPNTTIALVSAAGNSNFMEGTVTSYAGTTLVVNVTAIGGSGTWSDWRIQNVTSEISAGLRHYRGLWTQPLDGYRMGWHPEGVNADRGKAYSLLYRFEVKSTGKLTATVRSPVTGRREILVAKCGTNINYGSAEIPLSRLNFTQIGGDIRGAVVTQREGAGVLIEKILQESQFDIANISGLMVDRNRANPIYWSINSGALGAHAWGGAGEDVPDSITIEMSNPSELPSAVTLRYRNVEANYEAETVTATRATATHYNVVSIEFPMAFTPQEALRLAYVILDEAWMAQWQGAVTLLPAHLRAAVGDVLVVPDEDDFPRVFRIQRQKISDDSLIECTGPMYDGGVYGQYRSVEIEPRPEPGIIEYPAPEYAVWENVSLDDTMAASNGVLVAATSSGNWAGAIMRGDLGTVSIPYRAAMGELLTGYTYELEDATQFSYGVTVRVSLTYGALADANEADVRNLGANALAILTADGAMNVQFTTATQVNATDWDITGMLPGRKSTDFVLSAAIGDKVVLLSDETGARDPAITWVPLAKKYIGTTLDYTIEANSVAAASVADSITIAGITQWPLSPVRVRLVERLSGSVRFTWDARTRLESGASWTLTTPSDPNTFTVTANGVTKSVSTNEATFTSSDFGGVLPGSLSGTVRQKNTIVGNGFSRAYSGF